MTNPGGARTLGLIRIAFLVGVLAFGGIVWHLRRSGDTGYLVNPRSLRVAGQAVWGTMTLGTLALFLLAGRADPELRLALRVVLEHPAGQQDEGERLEVHLLGVQQAVRGAGRQPARLVEGTGGQARGGPGRLEAQGPMRTLHVLSLIHI